MSAPGEFICPICLSILIEPVTLPCGHELCSPCFSKTMQETNLNCPFCRLRVSCWARRAKKENSLVNEERWREIRARFPREVQRRLEGGAGSAEEEDGGSLFDFPSPACVQTISAPGEIRKEYEEELRKFNEEWESTKEEEAAATAAFIQKLKEEENWLKFKHFENQVENDEIIAKELSKCINAEDASSDVNVSMPVNRRLNVVVGKMRSRKKRQSSLQSLPAVHAEHLVKSEPINSSEYSDTVSGLAGCSSAVGVKYRKQSARSHSNDSIGEEMRHFKPIHSCPRTPPKQLPNGSVVDPPLVQTSPRNRQLVFMFPEKSSSEVSCGSLCVQNRLQQLDKERREVVSSLSKSTATEGSQNLSANRLKTDVQENFHNKFCTLHDENHSASVQKSSFSSFAAESCSPLEGCSSMFGNSKNECLQAGSSRESKNSETSNNLLGLKRKKKKIKNENSGFKNYEIGMYFNGNHDSSARITGSVDDDTAKQVEFDRESSHTLQSWLEREEEKQIELDAKLALELHMHYNVEKAIDRRKGTKNEYQLRSVQQSVLDYKCKEKL